jgi:hypothetical protein
MIKNDDFMIIIMAVAFNRKLRAGRWEGPTGTRIIRD